MTTYPIDQTQPPLTLPQARQRLWRLTGGGLLALFSGLAVAFLVLPLAGLLWRAIRADAWTGLSTGALTEAIRLSAMTTLASAGLIVLFGTPLAYALARWRFPFKRVINALVELPIVLPPAVAGLALLSVYGQRGLFGSTLDAFGLSVAFSTAAVVIAQVFVAAPFYIRAATIGFAAIPREVEDAARVDGADDAALFWFVTLPMASRALGAGLVLSWARALGEFGATLMFAGSLQGETQTTPLLIFETFQTSVDAAIAAGLILIALALVALLIARWLESRDDLRTTA